MGGEIVSPPVTYAVVFVLLLATLVPPIALTRSVFRYFRRRHGIVGAIKLVIATGLSFIPIALNLYLLNSAIPAIWSGTFQIDEKLGAALFVSWTTVWIKFTFRHMRRKRVLIH